MLPARPIHRPLDGSADRHRVSAAVRGSATPALDHRRALSAGAANRRALVHFKVRGLRQPFLCRIILLNRRVVTLGPASNGVVGQSTKACRFPLAGASGSKWAGEEGGFRAALFIDGIASTRKSHQLTAQYTPKSLAEARVSTQYIAENTRPARPKIQHPALPRCRGPAREVLGSSAGIDRPPRGPR
jgi:hypothetical protein